MITDKHEQYTKVHQRELLLNRFSRYKAKPQDLDMDMDMEDMEETSPTKKDVDK